MKVTYDIETDTLRIRLSPKRIEESNELSPGVIVDVDVKGNAVGFEILDASKRSENPQSVELDIVTETVKKKARKRAV